MQRPIMNPRFLEDGVHSKPKRRWIGWMRAAWGALGLAGRLLLSDIFRGPSRLKIDVGTPMRRALRGLCYRMLFLPVIMVGLAAVLVYTGTHPSVAGAGIDPTSHGMNYDPVSFTGEGGVKLDAWVVPVLDAKHVLAEKDKLLFESRPAVILIHDYGMSRQQMLPLVRPLHEAGYVVMLPTLRGSAEMPVGCTFGLSEAGDVKAAVETLRHFTFVDGRKIALIGIGSGANAAVLTAQHDPSISALVLDKPFQNFSEMLRDHIGPQQRWMHWIDPLCEWAFDVAYNVNASELNLQQSFHTLQGRGSALPMLVFDASGLTCLTPSKAKSIVDFLDAGMGVKRDPANSTQSAETSGKSAF